jgi:hypothetical protein
MLPLRLIVFAPKGSRDCGAHEWYCHDASTDRCYHCTVGERPHDARDLNERAAT